jgi:hypothetical protein
MNLMSMNSTPILNMALRSSTIYDIQLWDAVLYLKVKMNATSIDVIIA